MDHLAGGQENVNEEVQCQREKSWPPWWDRGGLSAIATSHATLIHIYHYSANVCCERVNTSFCAFSEFWTRIERATMHQPCLTWAHWWGAALMRVLSQYLHENGPHWWIDKSFEVCGICMNVSYCCSLSALMSSNLVTFFYMWHFVGCSRWLTNQQLIEYATISSTP
jgi:hypothetical protein